jgi:CubicO group peptidase (beta-lactamase class C family)
MRDTIPLVLSRVLWLTVALATRGGAQARPPVRGGAPAPGIGERITNGLRPLVHVTNGRDTTYALTDRMRNYHVAGVSIAVMDGGRVGWAQGFGVAEVGGTERVDTATLFQAGSISKPIFATAVLALVEQGRLVLDSDVTGQLRSWRLPPSAFTATEKVTLRRLLDHTAGLTVHGFEGYAAGAPVPSVPQVLDGLPPANSAPVRSDTVPGARWSYSGGGYTVAQLLATEVTGEPLPALVRRLVLRPLDMLHSTYEQPLPAALARHAASGHEHPDTVVPGRFHTYPELAAAGLWTTPSDLARWAISIANAYRGRPNKVLSARAVREMLTPQVTLPEDAPRPPSAWGLGVELAGAGDSLRFMHTGQNEGFVATLVMYPAQGRGLVVMINGTSPALLSEITRAFDAAFGLATEPRGERRLAAASPWTPDSALIGRYRAVVRGRTRTYTVSRGGDVLLLYDGGGELRRLLPEGSDAFFVVESPSMFAFERDAQGRGRSFVVRPAKGPPIVATRVDDKP